MNTGFIRGQYTTMMAGTISTGPQQHRQYTPSGGGARPLF
jgi:hypothetical protein